MAVRSKTIELSVQTKRASFRGKARPFLEEGEVFAFSVGSQWLRIDYAALRSPPKVAITGRLMFEPGPPRGG